MEPLPGWPQVGREEIAMAMRLIDDRRWQPLAVKGNPQPSEDETFMAWIRSEFDGFRFLLRTAEIRRDVAGAVYIQNPLNNTAKFEWLPFLEGDRPGVQGARRPPARPRRPRK
jgi:hypothetical protein